MPNSFELMTTLSITAITIATALAWYPAADGSRHYARIVEKTRSMPFTKSCSPDGSILPGPGSNCLEVPDYRFIRDGLGTVIARVAKDGTATVVFRKGTPDDMGSAGDLYLASKAIRG